MSDDDRSGSHRRRADRWRLRRPIRSVLGRLAWLAAFGFTAAGDASAQLPLAMPEEVPFIVTPDEVTVAMLELAGVGPRDHVVDLGSGDGRIVITAARRFGASGLGVEIVPDLVALSRGNARRAGVEGRARFEVQDLYATDLAPATVVTMYLLPEVNLALRPRLLALKPGTRIVSHDWDMADWTPDRTLTLAAPQKTVGRDKLSRLHLWTVPARVAGLWCGAGGAALQVEQRFQALQATLHGAGEVRSFHGHTDGPALRLLGGGGGAWALMAEGDDALRSVGSTAPGGAGSTWRRASASTCG